MANIAFLSSSVFSKPSVLIVEDELMVQQVHCKLFLQLGYHVDLAETVKQALSVFQKGYAVIFIDIGLPDGNGIDISKHIRQSENPNKRTPIIVITGYPLSEVKKICLDSGVDAVLSKPINAEVLKGTLHNILQS